MVRIEPFSGNRLITIISEPLCDLLERPILLSETNNGIVKKVLVLRVRRGVDSRQEVSVAVKQR